MTFFMHVAALIGVSLVAGLFWGFMLNPVKTAMGGLVVVTLVTWQWEAIPSTYQNYFAFAAVLFLVVSFVVSWKTRDGRPHRPPKNVPFM